MNKMNYSQDVKHVIIKLNDRIPKANSYCLELKPTDDEYNIPHEIIKKIHVIWMKTGKWDLEHFALLHEFASKCNIKNLILSYVQYRAFAKTFDMTIFKKIKIIHIVEYHNIEDFQPIEGIKYEYNQSIKTKKDLSGKGGFPIQPTELRINISKHIIEGRIVGFNFFGTYYFCSKFVMNKKEFIINVMKENIIQKRIFE